jgi:acetolactate synthase-1/2/3 large subunit
LNTAQRPVFIAGNGVAAEQGVRLQALAETLNAAIVTSYNAKGVVDESADCVAGMLGTWGHAAANRVVAAADCVVILGASMGPDYTRMRDPQLVRPGEQTLIQIDIDPRNTGWVYPVDLPITADCADVIAYLSETSVTTERPDWRQQVRAIKDRFNYDALPRFNSAPGTVHHADVVAALQRFLQPKDMLTLDAGANRIWATHGLRMRTPGRLLVPGGIGGMGWSPPAAAAAKLVYPERRVTALAGDGGFAITMNVIATCVQYDIDVTFLVSNNQGLGMVRDNLGERRIATDFGRIDFATVGEGMGATGLRVDHADGLLDALEQAHTTPGPVVIDVSVDPAASHKPACDTEAL